MIASLDAISRIRQPEYTGDDRCLPCTAVNVAIAIGFAAALGAAVSARAGVLAFGACLAIISLRGYLLPGTPALTRRYLPDRVRNLFGKTPARRPTIETAALDGAVDGLVAAGVVAQRADGLRLTPDFRERWRERLTNGGRESAPDALVEIPDTDDVASMFDTDDVEPRGDAAFELDGTRLVRWESTTALAAAVTADRELRSRLDGWAALDPDERRDVLTGLGLLWERCPACDGRVETRRERFEHCCQRPRVGLETVCAACGRSLAAVVVSDSSPLLEWVPESGREGAENRTTPR